MHYCDEALQRMERWEQKNGRKLSDLPPQEWVDTITTILPITKTEAWEYLASSNSSLDSQ